MEEVLDLTAVIREEAVAERLDFESLLGGLLEIVAGTVAGLLGSSLICRQHDPINVQSRMLRQKPQQCAATADLDIVRVRPQAEDRAELAKAQIRHTSIAKA